MMFSNKFKIKHKLTLIILLSVTVSVSLSLIVFITGQWGQMKIDTKNEMISHVKMVAHNTKAAILFDDTEDAAEVLGSIFIDRNDGIMFAAIFKPDKSLFVSKLDEETPSMPKFEIHQQGYVRDGLIIKTFEPIMDDNDVIGIVCLVASLENQLSAFYTRAGRAAIFCIIIMILSYFISARLQTIITQPVSDLLKLTRTVSQTSDYSLRGKKKTNDEVGDLVIAFNDMLTKIQLRDKELGDANKNLEDKVNARTSELQSTVEKLNESNQQLQQFTYIASHDLREPVRKISSFGSLLNDSLKGTLSEDDQENLDFMIDGANRMQKMIDALLTYSRVTTKEIEKENVDLNQILEELQTLELAIRIEESDAEINIEGPLPNVIGDATQLRQLLQNLVGNALKYIPKDKKPIVKIKAIDQPNNMTRIEITDNGIGIKPEHFENIFVMFRRLHSRSQYEGTGIGLAVCKKIVDRHGGKLSVQSEYKNGSTFSFTVKKSDKNIDDQGQKHELEQAQTI